MHTEVNLQPAALTKQTSVRQAVAKFAKAHCILCKHQNQRLHTSHSCMIPPLAQLTQRLQPQIVHDIVTAWSRCLHQFLVLDKQAAQTHAKRPSNVQAGAVDEQQERPVVPLQAVQEIQH